MLLVLKRIYESDTNAFRYCGEYYDTESDTIYLRARYYDPTIGRFISRDSFAGSNNDPLSLNLYTYCHNNPIIYQDKSGHWIHLAIGAAVGALVGGAIKVATNLIDPEKDWNDGLGTAMIAGAASGFLASTGVGLVGQVAGNAAISMANNAADQVIDNKGFKNFNVGSMLFDGVVGGIAGRAGGAGAGSKHLNKIGKQLFKRTFNTTTHKGLKAGAKEFVKASANYVKNAKHFIPVFKSGMIKASSVSGSVNGYKAIKSRFKKILKK